MLILGATLIFILYGPANTQISFEDQKPTYTIVAPKKLRPNLEYHVSVSLHDALSAITMNVAVSGPSDGGSYNRVDRDIILNPRETQIINFDIGEWGAGKYNLTVVSRGSFRFENTTQLEYEHKSYSVFIQTDKAVYKPGQLVQFRVIVVNPYLSPSVTGAIDMFVRDAKSNRIKQWKRVFTTRGIVSEQLQLSNDPVLGDWTIHVDVLNQTFHKAFTVAEYVLPTFDVQIELPPYATYNKSDIVATVKAMYTYGKPVKGEVTLTVAPLTRYNYLAVRPYEQYQTKARIDGTADIYMVLKRDLSLKTDFFEREIEFFALVEEELTGRKYNTTNTMHIFDKDIKVELIKTSETFKPGLKYTAFLKVAYQDNTPVNDANSQLKLRYGYSYNEEVWSESYYTVPPNGIIPLIFYPANDPSISILNFRAEFKGQTHFLNGIEPAASPSNNFIQVVLLDQDPQVGKVVNFEVNATEPMTQLIYQVMGRGDIVFARSLDVPSTRTFKFSFPVNHRMAPRARVIVYYVRKNNSEVVADSVNFEVEGVFRTPVVVQTSVKETKPGARVDVRVQTKPNAYVGLLGIDQSVLLLKSGNDITQKQVIEELETYDGGKQLKEIPPWYRRRKRSLWWTGSVSAGKIFEDSGVVILSNGLVYKLEQLIFYRMSPHSADSAHIGPRHDSENSVSPKESKSGVRVRKLFPETWLWNATVAGNDGIAVVSSAIPDTITSWIISAFAMDSITGLGIASDTAKVTVFRPFFIKMNLPYAVLRGESVAIQIIVFNYMKKPIEADVTMENRRGDFEFVVAGSNFSDAGQERKTKPITVPPEDGASVSFLVKPLRLGYMDIRVTASSSLASDAVVKRLLVKPEGAPQYFNKAVLLDFRNPNSRPVKTNFSIPIPYNAINGSTKITVSVIGDLMGTSVNNLDSLLRMPFGCGEQNMLNFVPNIVVTKYLQRANRLAASVKNRAISFMESGYQRELTYKRDDGSFSAFGNRDKSGSTWLTSFVVKSFLQAKPYIDIDEKVIEESQKWLVARQRPDGSFEEPGEVHHKAMQGGSGSDGALTAFVLLALLENQSQRQYSREISLAEQFVATQVRNTDDPYIVAIGCYALHLADNPAKDSILQKLSTLAKRDGDVAYWTRSKEAVNTTDKMSDYYFLPQSLDVEMTAYALLTYALRAEIVPALPIMRWLISQQNDHGGFASTQDTVVGIQALGSMAERLVSSTISIDVKLNYDTDRSKAVKIDSDNAIVQQKIELPAETRSVEIEASGYGVAVVQVSWVFNLAVSGEQPAFYLNPLLDKTSTESYLQLSVCTHYKDEGKSNMAVMEVALPSGYLADVDALPSILQIQKVKRVEAANSDTSVVIYFDGLNKEDSCVTVPAHRSFKVANQKPVPVKVYDYYNLAKSARMFYHPHEATLCDICEGGDCSEGCNVVDKSRDQQTGTTGDAPSLLPSAFTLCALTLAALSRSI